jgi:hypothetical protein
MRTLSYILEQYYAFTKVQEILHNIELFYGKPEWEYDDEEITMSEDEFDCWLKVAVIWVKNIHQHESRKRKTSNMSGVALIGVDVGLSANEGSKGQRHSNHDAT